MALSLVQTAGHFQPRNEVFGNRGKEAGHAEPFAYYHKNWTRGGAPLLDELGAVVDHVKAFASGGQCEEQNLVTACCKCNGRKSSASLDAWNQREKRAPIKGKYGEPQHWDWLSTAFIVLAESHPEHLTAGEKEWLRALKNKTYGKGYCNPYASL